MTAKYSVNELAIGRTIPIKLRFVIDRSKLGQPGVVRRLANMLCERGQHKDQDAQTIKQIRYRSEVRTSQASEKIVRVKSKRVVSHKNSRAREEMHNAKEKQFFEFNNIENRPPTLHFKPYHLQQEYKNSESREVSLKQPIRNIRRSTQVRRKVEHFSGMAAWRLDKWQTEQQSMISSFLNKT